MRESSLGVDVDAHHGRDTGHPLEYSFNFDDGKPETTGANPNAHHDYSRPGTYTVRVEVKDPLWGTHSSLEQKVTVR